MSITLGDRIRRQALACNEMGSSLYGVLLAGAAQDWDGGGIVRDLLKGDENATEGSVPALRLAGALHRLVLEGKAPELAEFYPSAGGTRPPDDVWPAAHQVLVEQQEAIRSRIKLTVQTNETARAVALLTGLLHITAEVGIPQVRLLEVGASAGLTLRFDRFRLTAGDSGWGDPHSPVVLTDPWEDKVPDLSQPLEIVDRRGCDPHPLDPTTRDGQLTLLSYVWPDQTARVERLRGALEIAQRVPAQVDQGSCAEWVAQRLAEPTEAITVVWHSVVMQYVEPAERARLDEVLRTSGLPGPLWRLSYEPMRQLTDGYYFQLKATEHRDGLAVETVIGGGGGHGPPLRITL